MKKKIIALAVAAAFTTPAVADNINFNFYGVADLSYDFVNTGDGVTTANGATAVSGTSKRVLSSNVSKFGFKGTEELSEGLTANWQIEQQINLDDAAKNTFASRNTFVNLKSEKLGTLLFGIYDTPYKVVVRKLDVFADSIGDNRSLLGAPKKVAATAATATAAGAPGFAGTSNLGFELRPTDVLAYTSPTFSGITASVATVNLSEANYSNVTKNNNVLSLAVVYDVAPYYGSIAHESHKLETNVTTTQGQDESATRFGFGYKPGEQPFELSAVYEKTKDNLGTAEANTLGHSAIYLGGKYNIGNNAVKLGYSKASAVGTGTAQVADSGASQVTLGYDHGVSKRTKVYALYSKISNGKGINYGFAQSSGAGSTSSGFGTSPSVVSLGVKHTF